MKIFVNSLIVFSWRILNASIWCLNSRIVLVIIFLLFLIATYVENICIRWLFFSKFFLSIFVHTMQNLAIDINITYSINIIWNKSFEIIVDTLIFENFDNDFCKICVVNNTIVVNYNHFKLVMLIVVCVDLRTCHVNILIQYWYSCDKKYIIVNLFLFLIYLLWLRFSQTIMTM